MVQGLRGAEIGDWELAMADHASPRLTDERLRTWLDADQLSRERLCQALLALDRRFQTVRPRQPRGGPDQGRDLEAEMPNVGRVWAAIGFQNSVGDTPVEQSQEVRKFQSDLTRALQESPGPSGFVFMTNVNLTAPQKDALVSEARRRGMKFCEVFDRERLRILLDAPDGLAARFQHLGIALSDAEQAAFFARWGGALQDVITESFDVVRRSLARIEFHHEKQRPLRHLAFQLGFSRAVRAQDLPHVRAVLSLETLGARPAISALHLGVCNDDGRWSRVDAAIGTALVGALWTDNAAAAVTRFQKIRPEPMTSLTAHGGYSEWGITEQQPTLGELDESLFAFFVSKSVADLVQQIDIIGNEYLLWQSARADLDISPADSPPTWPYTFSPAELDDPWMRIMPKTGAGRLVFSAETPRRLYDAQVVP